MSAPLVTPPSGFASALSDGQAIGGLSRPSLLLLGAFAVGFNASHAIHELGHALAVWLSGGRVTALSLHPFSWSTIDYSVPTTAPIALAGAGFAVLIGLLILRLVWCRRSPWVLPLVMTSLCTLVVNATYLVVDGVLLAGGDATDLVALGFPRPAILAAGAGLLAFGFVVALPVLPRLGLHAADGFGPRFGVLGAGIGSYLLAMFAYHVAFNTNEIMLWSVYTASGLRLVAVWAAVTRLAESRWAWVSSQRAGRPGWGPALAFSILGVIAVLTLLGA